MGFPQSAHAYADLRRPQPWGCCDRCGFRYMRNKIDWQFDWRGNQMQNLRILVDHRCMDVPQPQLRPIIVGPDPYPVRDPRPGFASSQQGPVPAPPLTFVVPTNAGLYETTDQGEVIDDDQGNPIRIFGPFVDPLATFGLANVGGVLKVTSPNYWPGSPTGLGPGALWSEDAFAFVVPGNTPNPSAPPVIFGAINAFGLLALTGVNLPFAPVVANQIWNNAGTLNVSAP